MKIKNLKYIFSLVFCALFFSYVFASDPVPSDSYCTAGSHSSNGHLESQASSNVTDPNRYYNNEIALKWWYKFTQNDTIDVGPYITKKLQVFGKYDGMAGVSSAKSVWHLQSVLSGLSCQISTDCKLGKDTSSQFFGCAVCQKIDNRYSEPSITLSCEGDNKKQVVGGTGDGYCCQPKCDGRGIEGLVDKEGNGSCRTGYLPAESPNSDCCQKALCDGEDIQQVNSSFECANGYEYDTATACCKRKQCSTLGDGFIDKNGECGEGYTPADADFCCKPSCASLGYEDKNQVCDGNGLVEVTGTGAGYCCKAVPTTCESPNLDKPDQGSCITGYKEEQFGNLTCCTWECPNNNEYSSGGSCQPCLTGTVPNSSHTKCICDSSVKCCGIQLNMSIPFIGDCIESESDDNGTGSTVVNSVTAFPILLQGMMKLFMSVILVVSFLLVIVSGVMMTSGAFKSTNFEKGKTLLKNVIISLILLGLSGLILKLINPSFFGG